MFNYHLSDLPGYGKLFVAIFTTLMLGVMLWAALIFYVSQGLVDKNHLPAYLSENAAPEVDSTDFPQDVEDISSEDSSAVLAPIWDTTMKGQEVNLDTATADESTAVRKAVGHQAGEDRTIDMTGYDGDTDDGYVEGPTHFRKNIGLAHTHINGQTLLFFALGVVFLFTSAKAQTKKYVYWTFGIAVVLHNIGLTGRGFYSFFDDMLAISGVALLVIITYMAFVIYIDLAKPSRHATNNVNTSKTGQ